MKKDNVEKALHLYKKHKFGQGIELNADGGMVPNNFAGGGDIGSLAALTNAIENKPQFPQVVGGNETKHYNPVPIKPIEAMDDGGVAGSGELAMTEAEQEAEDEAISLGELEAKARGIRATANDPYVSAGARSSSASYADKLEATLARRRQQEAADLNALDAADVAGEVASDEAQAAATQPPNKKPMTGGMSPAPTSPEDIGKKVVDALRKSGVAKGLPEDASVADKVAAALKASSFSTDAAAGETAKMEKEKAADVVAKAAKEKADAEVAKAKALKDASVRIKEGKGTEEDKTLILDHLSELAGEARVEVDKGMKSAAARSTTTPAATATTGGAGDVSTIPAKTQTADEIAAATLGGAGAISEVPTTTKGADIRLALPDDLQVLLGNAASRYEPATFDALGKLSGRVGVVYKIAKNAGMTDDVARKVAVDEGVKDLQQANLPKLPSGEEAMAIARNSPEVAAMREAAARQAQIKLRDTDLATQEAVATTRLREAQNDLALAQANDFEVRRTRQQAQLDKMREGVINDTLNLDRFVSDAKTRSQLSGMQKVLAFAFMTMGSKINPYELVRDRVQQELNTQLSIVDRKRTLLGELVQEGNSMDDAYKLAEAQLKQLFALQLQKAAAPLRDERQRLAGLDAANKLMYDAAKAQEEVVGKQVNAIYEPYKIKMQGTAAGMTDIFQYLKEGGDMAALQARLKSEAADRAVRSGELGVRKEEAQLKREDLQVKAAGNQLVGKLLAGQPLANAGEYASVVSSNPELRKTLVKPFSVDATTGKVSTQPGFLLARSDKAAEDLVELKGLSEKSLDFLDRMESLLSKNGYNYRSMSKADQGAFNTARDEFVSALGSKAARNVGVPSDKEYERLAGSVPDASWYEDADRAAAKLKEFRRITAGVLQRAYDNNVYTAGQTGGTTAPAAQKATFQVRKKGTTNIQNMSRQDALDLLKMPGGDQYEVLP
jgi:hypothetical protein